MELIGAKLLTSKLAQTFVYIKNKKDSENISALFIFLVKRFYYLAVKFKSFKSSVTLTTCALNL